MCITMTTRDSKKNTGAASLQPPKRRYYPLRLPEEWIDRAKQLALEESLKEGNPIPVATILRRWLKKGME